MLMYPVGAHAVACTCRTVIALQYATVQPAPASAAAAGGSSGSAAPSAAASAGPTEGGKAIELSEVRAKTEEEKRTDAESEWAAVPAVVGADARPRDGTVVPRESFPDLREGRRKDFSDL